MTSNPSSNLLAYSPDPQNLGAVWVPKGESLSPVGHQQRLGARLQRLLDLSPDPEALRARVENEYLEPQGLTFDQESSVETVAFDWAEALAASGTLNLQSAVLGRNVVVSEDNPKARERLEAELNEPEQNLLLWVSQALQPLTQEDSAQPS
jgi:hypothetical protein